jgi:fatty-acyl-CoA synthase
MSVNGVNYDVLTPVSFLARSARVYGTKDAVVYDSKRYTYAEFQLRVFRLANALLKAGVGKDDKVAFICPNIPPMLEAHFAVPMIGAALVSINIRLSSREVAYIINHSDSKVVFADNEFAGLVTQKLRELPNVSLFVNICDAGPERPLDGPEYEEFLAAASDAPVPCAVEDERSLATINYTSGTTGLPKGVMYHHRGAYLNALGEALEHGMDSTSVYLWTLPMFHCNGWCFPWGVTSVGATHVCLRKVVPEEIYRLVESEAVSHLCAAPTVLISMSAYPGAMDVKMKRQLKVVTGGAPPAPMVIRNMESIGARVKQVYGLTEVYGPHTICEYQAAWDALPPEERAKYLARQGVANVTAAYVDVVNQMTMEPVPRDGQTMGEIVMRGNNVMLGYYKQEESSADAFRGGWFHSGDLAVMHPEGYIEIKDRSKDIIISGGENISSVEIENIIYSHPLVQEVAVIGVPDEKWGEVPKAFIVPKPGASPTPEDIVVFCRENLARFKVPKHIEFGELPKTATGKILKYELRNKEWAGRERKVN